MKHSFQKGFTLIELLVVIAIIGLLSSVVLASLNTARGKGADAAIRSNVANIATQAEVQYEERGCYAADSVTCSSTVPAAVAEADCVGAGGIFADTIIAQQIVAADAALGAAGFTACSASAGGTAWALAIQLKTDVTKAICIDSTGVKKTSTVATNDQAGLSGVIASNICS